jgi:hypothetical protein
MFEFIKKYSFLIKVYAIILIILNLVLIGMYFRFKKTLRNQKQIIDLYKLQKQKPVINHNHNEADQNITIKIEEV